MPTILLVEDNANNASLLEDIFAYDDIPARLAYAMPGDEERARAAGCEEYFAKPLSMRTLGDRLKTFLQELEKAEGREYAST